MVTDDGGQFEFGARGGAECEAEGEEKAEE
jgi:hypothetical protein